MKICPCCSTQMQRYIQSHHVYWFCRHCWQEMPEVEAITQISSVNFAVSKSTGRIST